MTAVLGVFVLLFAFSAYLFLYRARGDNGAYLQARFWFIPVVVLSPLFFITAFRGLEIGIDTFSYYLEYMECSYICEFRRSEPLFSAFITFLSGVGIDFRGFLVIQSLAFYLSMALVFLCSPRQTFSLCICYLLFVATFGLFAFGLSGIRQSLAISIFLISFPLLLSKSYIGYGILASAAVLVHNTAALPFLGLFFFAVVIKTDARLFLLMTFFSPLAAFLSPDLFVNVSNIDFKQAGYLGQGSYDLINLKVPLLFYILALAAFIIVAFSPATFWISRSKPNLFSSSVFRVCAWSVVFISFTLWLATSVRLAERLALYFMPFAALFFVLIFGHLRNTYLVLAFKILWAMTMAILGFYVNRNLLF